MPVVRISEELFKEIQKYAEPLVDDFESALRKALNLNKISISNISSQKERPIIRRVRGKTTAQYEFRKPILQIILDAGGEEDAKRVIESVEKGMKNQFLPGDYELNRDGTPKWFKAVHFQRLVMVHDGLLASDSPRGVWTITEKGKQWLSEQL